MRHADFIQFLNDFVDLFGEEIGTEKYLDMLKSYRLDDTKSYASQLTRECLNGVCEAFNWVKPLIQYLRADEASKYYKVRALTATLSANKNDYSDLKELERSARTLTSRPLNINHDHNRWLPYPENRVEWAEYEDKAVEAIIRISNDQKDIQYKLDNGEIVNPSIEGDPRGGYTTEDGRMVPVWYNFTALALLEKDVTLPGVPTTYGFEPLFLNESLGRSLVESLRNVEKEEKEKKMTDEKERLTEATQNESCAQCKHFLEYLPTTTKTPKVQASEPSDTFTLTAEGGFGPGCGECQVSKEMVRKNDAACTDWRQRTTPTSADDDERIIEKKSVEDMIMKQEMEELKVQLLEALQAKNREIEAHTDTRKELADVSGKLTRSERERAIADSKATRISGENAGLKEKLEKLKDTKSTLEVENAGYVKERDMYKDDAKRFEEMYDKLNVAFKETKDELGRTLTQLSDAKNDRALAVQKSINSEGEKARATIEVAELTEKLTDVHRQLFDSTAVRASSAKQVLKYQQENTRLSDENKKLIEEIRDMKQKLSKVPKRIIVRTG